MALKIDKSKKKNKPIISAEKSEPSKTFDLNSLNTTESKQKLGRPKKNKVYSTIRIQKHNINRVNALQNTLEMETQDDMISFMLDRLENSLTNEERTMFEMYMRTYKAREERKNK